MNRKNSLKTKKIFYTLLLSLIFIISVFAPLISSNPTGLGNSEKGLKETTNNPISISQGSGDESWWNYNWQYRLPINIISTSGDLTNYQVKLELNLTKWYNKNYLNETGKDIRFTDVSSQELDFWIENMNVTGGNSSIWVKIPDISNENTTKIFMYFGNPDAISNSNGINTFVLFEDFENYDSQADGELPSGWNDYSNGDIRLDSDGVNRVLLKTANNDPNGGYKDFNEELSDFEVTFKTNRINQNGGSQNRYAIENNFFNGYGPRISSFGGSATYAIERRDNGGSQGDLTSTTITPNTNTWYIFKYRKYGNTLESELYDINGNLISSLSYENDPLPHTGSFDRFMIHGGWEYWTDDIILRKYTSNEPSVYVGDDVEVAQFNITCLDVDGQRVEGAHVYISSNETDISPQNGTTDENGEIVFNSVLPAYYNITVNYTINDGLNNPLTEKVYYEEDYYRGDPEKKIYVNLWTIDFQVKDINGDPLKYGYVNISEEENNNILSKLELDSSGEARFLWNASKTSYNYSVYYYNPAYETSNTRLYTGIIYPNETYREYYVNQTAEFSTGNTYYVEDSDIYLYDDSDYSGPNEMVEIRLKCWDMKDNLSQINIRYSDEDHITEYTDEQSANIIYKPLEDGENLYAIEEFRVDFQNMTQNNGIIQLYLTHTYRQEITVNMSKLSLRILDKTEEGGVAGLELKIKDTVSDQEIVTLDTDSDGYAYDGYTDVSFWYLTDRKYNITMSFQDEERLFNVKESNQTKPENTYWYNYTLITFDEIVFSLTNINYSERLANFTSGSGPISVTWGENMIFWVIYETTNTTGEENWAPDYQRWGIETTATIEILDRNNNILFESSMNNVSARETNEGNFSITVDSTLFSAGGNGEFYFAYVYGQKALWSSPNRAYFGFTVEPKPTTIELYNYSSKSEIISTKRISQYYDELINISLGYNSTSDNQLLGAEEFTYSWDYGEGNLQLDPLEVDNYYYFTINTSSAPNIGQYSVDIVAKKENYSTINNYYFTLIIKERLTRINGSSQIQLSPKLWVFEARNFTFEYTDNLTGNRVSGLETAYYEWFKLDEMGNEMITPGDHGIGDLFETTGSQYVLDFDTETRELGEYSIWVYLRKNNYQLRIAHYTIEIQKRMIDALDLPSKQVNVVQGDSLTFTITLRDPTNNSQLLSGANVTLIVQGMEYKLNEVQTGIYEYQYGTSGIDAFFMPVPLTAELKIERGQYYEEETYDFSIIVGMTEIFPGFPMFYFLLILIGVVLVVGSIATYRYIQIRRIPEFVKRARAMKKEIKGRKSISEKNLYPSKEEFITKMYGEDWEKLGLSLKDKLGLQGNNDKKLNKSKEGGVY
ncbi:MAG: DUF2341 domain-containing protein [Promethearchaeota archaeon]|nr:MAG: DUF2341 domain-containing protein [Candidatus Lokiarchaeota archaeon]